MNTIFYSHSSKTHFHKKGFEKLSLGLKMRVFGTRKWPFPEGFLNPSIDLELIEGKCNLVVVWYRQSSGNYLSPVWQLFPV